VTALLASGELRQEGPGFPVPRILWLRIDDALGKIEAQARDDVLVELLPEECGVELLFFMVGILKKS
jgi:hypothetical protein